MNKEIKFRGKTADGKWVYGSYFWLAINGKAKHFIIKSGFIMHENFDLTTVSTEVIPETVGQFTGLLDGKGNEIYEWDIMKFVYCPKSLNQTHIGIVQTSSWHDWALYVDGEEYHICYAVKYGEVIGNIHDNLELLTEKNSKQ